MPAPDELPLDRLTLRIDLLTQVCVRIDPDLAAARPTPRKEGDTVSIGEALLLLEAQWRRAHPEAANP